MICTYMNGMFKYMWMCMKKCKSHVSQISGEYHHPSGPAQEGQFEREDRERNELASVTPKIWMTVELHEKKKKKKSTEVNTPRSRKNEISIHVVVDAADATSHIGHLHDTTNATSVAPGGSTSRGGFGFYYWYILLVVVVVVVVGREGVAKGGIDVPMVSTGGDWPETLSLCSSFPQISRVDARRECFLHYQCRCRSNNDNDDDECSW